MNSIVYILYSKIIDRYYTGSTVLDAEERLERHLSDYYGSLKYTHKARDWVIYLTINCESKKQSRLIEYHIKRMKSRKYIEDLKQYPEKVEGLLLRFREGQN